jgi:hypothetical protein
MPKMQQEKKNDVVSLALAKFKRAAVSQTPAAVEPSPKGVTVMDAMAVFRGAKIVSETPSLNAKLWLSYPPKYPEPPINVAPGVVMTDPAKFVAKAVTELDQYTAAVNKGRKNYVGNCFLAKELIEKLAACGVTAAITGIDGNEPEIKPLKSTSNLERTGREPLGLTTLMKRGGSIDQNEDSVTPKPDYLPSLGSTSTTTATCRLTFCHGVTTATKFKSKQKK